MAPGESGEYRMEQSWWWREQDKHQGLVRRGRRRNPRSPSRADFQRAQSDVEWWALDSTASPCSSRSRRRKGQRGETRRMRCCGISRRFPASSSASAGSPAPPAALPAVSLWCADISCPVWVGSKITGPRGLGWGLPAPQQYK